VGRKELQLPDGVVSLSSVVVAFFSVVVGIVALFVAFRSLRQSQKALAHNMLTSLVTLYLSPEMGDAVARMWFHYRKYGIDGFVQEYLEQSGLLGDLKDQQYVGRMVGDPQSELRDARRLVSHFFQHVARINAKQVIPKELVFAMWSDRDLDIIPKMIIPIEKAIHEVHYGQPSSQEDFFYLRKLYEDSVQYRANKRANG
jgi:hypothetical protein